jgi:hypothetical protein
MLQNSKNSNTKNINDHQLKFEVEYRKNLQDICNKINAADNLDEILVDLKDEITKRGLNQEKSPQRSVFLYRIKAYQDIQP